MDRTELETFWYGRYVENYPEEFFSLIQEVKKINPLMHVLEIGVKHCGTLRVWEKLVPAQEGLIITVDITKVEELLAYSGRTAVPQVPRPGHANAGGWWYSFPTAYVEPQNCTEDCFDPEASDREVHMLTGKAETSEIRQQIELILGGRQFDFIFHDGDHEIPAPFNDFQNLVSFLRPGGVFCFADTNCDGVKQILANLPAPHVYSFVQPRMCGFALWVKSGV